MNFCRSGSVYWKWSILANGHHVFGIWTCSCIINVLPFIFLFWPYYGSGWKFFYSRWLWGLGISDNISCFLISLFFFFFPFLLMQNVVLLVNFFTGLILMVLSFIMGLIETTASANSFLKVDFLISFFKCLPKQEIEYCRQFMLGNQDLNSC